MSFRQTTLERAFDLAKSGEYAGMAEIKTQLKAEGFELSQLHGSSLSKQLRDLCTSSRMAREAQDASAP